MARNSYPAVCDTCGAAIPANGGFVHRGGAGKKWEFECTVCMEKRSPTVTVITTDENGRTIYVKMTREEFKRKYPDA